MTRPPLPIAAGPILTDTLERLGPIPIPDDLRPISPDVRAARRAWADARAAEGLARSGRARILTAPGAQAKLGKGEVPLFSLTLAPSDTGGLGFTTCGSETATCRAACVLTHGRGSFPSVRAVRRARTRLLATDPAACVTLVASEAVAAARRLGGVGLRPNAASDIRWERVAPGLLELPGVRAYDYTKHADRVASPGYHLTYSVSERPGSVAHGLSVIARGGTATVVVAVGKGEPLPDRWVGGVPMVDGDVTDDRAADPPGVWVGLRAKGALVGADPSNVPFVFPADPSAVPARALVPARPAAA